MTAVSNPYPSDLTRLVDDAIRAEERHDRINAAKIRSVEQHSDYDQFVGMVAAAHLKPVDLHKTPLDSIAANTRNTKTRDDDHTNTIPSLSTAPLLGKSRADVANEKLSAELLKSRMAPPKTAYEMCREWRRLCLTGEDWALRYAYLRLIDGANVPRFMSGGLMTETIGRIYETIERKLSADGEQTSADISHAYRLLYGITFLADFAMSKTFMLESERTAVRTLCERIVVGAPETDDSRQIDNIEEPQVQIVSTFPPVEEFSSFKISSTPALQSMSDDSSTYPMLLPGWNSSTITTKRSQAPTAKMPPNNSRNSSTIIKLTIPPYNKSNAIILRSKLI